MVESEEAKGSTFSFKVKLEKSNKENIVATTQDTKKAMKLVPYHQYKDGPKIA